MIKNFYFLVNANFYIMDKKFNFLELKNYNQTENLEITQKDRI